MGVLPCGGAPVLSSFRTHRAGPAGRTCLGPASSTLVLSHREGAALCRRQRRERLPRPQHPAPPEVWGEGYSPEVTPCPAPPPQGCRSVEEFQCLNRIEEGTYGVVYRAKDKKTGGQGLWWPPRGRHMVWGRGGLSRVPGHLPGHRAQACAALCRLWEGGWVSCGCPARMQGRGVRAPASGWGAHHPCSTGRRLPWCWAWPCLPTQHQADPRVTPQSIAFGTSRGQPDLETRLFG